METDGRFLRFFGVFHELANRIEDREDLVVVILEFVFELVDFGGELVVGGEELAKLDEGADDEEAGFDGLGAVKDGGGHDGAVLGEGIGEGTRAAPT